AIAGMPGEHFYTSDHADPTLHPKLSITYACECGVSCLAPQGSGNVLFVVVNEWDMTADELAKKALFESWGYTVNLISQWDVAWNYNNLAADNDVAYVSESVDDTAWGLASGLAASTIGVVNEEGAINDDLGTSGSYSYNVGKNMDVIDNSHYITSLFPAGTLPIYSASMEGLQTTGTMATDLQSLGNFNSMTGLAVVETGGLLADGSSIAAGRRVMLPIGRSGSFSLDYLNNNGRLIVQRALEWGAGNDDVCTDGNFRDQFDVIAFNNSDGSLDWSGDWAEIDSTASGAFSGKLLITAGELRINGPSSAFVNPATGVTLYDPSLTRELDLSVYQSATLSFSFHTGSGVETGEDSAVVEISGNGGTSWTILEDFNTAAGETMGVRSYDITPYLSANTQVRFRINSAYGGPNEYFYVDNVDITASCSAPTAALPIAHWKLDDATGIIALDSEGGHDGTLNNSLVWAAGQLEGALDFDGINDAIRVPHNDALSLTETLTFTAWIKPELISIRYKTVLAKDDGSGNSNYWFGLWQDELAFGFFSGGFFREVFTNGLNIQAGIWQHIAVSFNNSTDEVRLYLDGAMVHTGVLTYSPTVLTVDLGIARSPAAGENWNGLLDDIRIYDQVLPPSELSTLSTGAAGGGSVEPPPPSDTCDGTFRDDFTGINFSGTNGSLDWSASPWAEVGESDGAAGGDVQVMADQSNYQLRIRDKANGGEGVARMVDLSGAISAVLSFDYRRMNLDKSSDYVELSISMTGTGGPWTPLDQFGTSNDTAYQSYTRNITEYISANTAIQLRSSSKMGPTDTVWFDNIQIQCSP
ncbi:MAG: LamG domain-containing protein, partial [Gammaproteobacteria bacterium]|nr:LamG domain-containing protein [Gammaproteobacteria bacterium]